MSNLPFWCEIIETSKKFETCTKVSKFSSQLCFPALYACLSVGYFEGTLLVPRLLPIHFTLTECKLIEEIFKRFMDDGFVLLPKNANIDVLRELLNKLHP